MKYITYLGLTVSIMGLIGVPLYQVRHSYVSQPWQYVKNGRLYVRAHPVTWGMIFGVSEAEYRDDGEAPLNARFYEEPRYHRGAPGSLNP